MAGASTASSCARWIEGVTELGSATLAEGRVNRRRSAVHRRASRREARYLGGTGGLQFGRLRNLTNAVGEVSSRVMVKTHTGRQEGPAWGTRCLGGFLAATVLFLAAMTASPVAHGEIHHDSGQPEHQCAVTMFAHGVESVQCAVGVAWIPSSAGTGALMAPEFLAISEPAHLRPPASGPPVA